MLISHSGKVEIIVKPARDANSGEEYDGFSCTIGEIVLIKGIVGKSTDNPKSSYEAMWPSLMQFDEAHTYLPEAGVFGDEYLALWDNTLGLSWNPNDTCSPAGCSWFGLHNQDIYRPGRLRVLLENTATPEVVENIDDIMALLVFLYDRLGN